MQHEAKARIIKRVRIRIGDVPECLGRFAMLVGEFGGRFGSISTVSIGKKVKIRDVDIHARDEVTFDRICDAIRKMESGYEGIPQSLQRLLSKVGAATDK